MSQLISSVLVSAALPYRVFPVWLSGVPSVPLIAVYVCTLRCASLTNLAYAALMSSGLSSMCALVTSAYNALHAQLIIAASLASAVPHLFYAWLQAEQPEESASRFHYQGAQARQAR